MPNNTLAGGGITVCVDESTDGRIVVTGLEVIEPGLGIVVVATVAQRVDLRHGASGRDYLAVGVIIVGGDDVSTAVNEVHHIALQVGHIVVQGAIMLEGKGSTVIVVEEVQSVAAISFPQQLATGIDVIVSGCANSFLGT